MQTTTADRPRRRLCGACILPCSVSLLWLIGALSAMLAGWGLFAWAAAYSVRHHTPIHGYEWVPGFLVMPLAWVCVSGIRRGAGWGEAERTASENEHFLRMLGASLLVGGAIIMVVVTVPFAWFELLALGPEEVAMAALHSSSPSPSVAPSGSSKSAARRDVGIFLLAHFVALCFSLVAYWQYGENWRIEQARLEGDAGLELSQL